mmetsp:Transcript_9575/g.39224  ORF Transcript_9575/g.39224 Transcript_9575/m.39224 type:complete len:246 (-) Transcript_9575:3185-3922(-)
MDAPPLGWTAEGRARKMRALRAEAGRKAKEELDAARERLRKKEALLRRMKQDRLKEHETLRRMATADDGEALERRAREAEARADDKENRRLWFRPCETCFEIRRAAAHGKDPDYASRLCTRCNARAVKEAAEEVRRVRLDDGARENDDDEDDAPGTNPRTADALRADLAAAEAAVALSGEEWDRLAALDRCAQLRVAIETARVGATREARRRRLEEKEEDDDDERVDLNTSMETEPGTGETWINS